MRKQSSLILTVIVAALVSYLTVTMMAPSAPMEAKAKKESVYKRVMRTGVLRCGYALWPPTLVKDPNTGTLSGVYYDYMKALGQRLGLEIEWHYELTLATYLEDLNTGKYDIECSGGWPNARRAKYAEYTVPLYYTPVYLYVAAGRTEFDNNLAAINDPSVRFVTMPGEQSEDYRNEFLSATQNISISPSMPLSDLLLQLITGKGDVVFYDHMSARMFMKQHPGKIRRIVSPPVKIIPNNLSVAKGEFKLVTMINHATRELMFDGTIEDILQKYDLDKDIALRPIKPYEVPQ